MAPLQSAWIGSYSTANMPRFRPRQLHPHFTQPTVPLVTMEPPPKFHVREASTTKGDPEFIIATFDSAISYLASIGSHEQWGPTPFSEREGWTAETLQQVRDAGDTFRIFIVEATGEVPVGFAFVRENHVPEYIFSQDHIKIDDADKDSCVYIEVMIRVPGAAGAGAGTALIQGIRAFGCGRGRRVLFVDGWAGNERKLIG